MKAGADARCTGPEGETALMIASRTGRVEVVRLLLARGADVNAKERWYGQTALMWAAAENHPAVVRALIDAGATIDARAERARAAEARHRRFPNRQERPGAADAADDLSQAAG